jgi:hypothetical protein
VPGLDHIWRAFDLVPQLDIEDFKKALNNAEKSVTPDAESEAVGNLNAHFKVYCQHRIFCSSTVNLLCSDAAKNLKRLKEKANSLLEFLTAQSPAGISLQLSIKLQAKLQAEKNPSDRFDPGFRGIEKYSQIVQSLQTLKDFSVAAHSMEREKIEAGKRDPKNVGDPEINELLRVIGIFWEQTFNAIPAVSWDEHHSSPTGHYLAFVKTLLHSYADRISDDLEKIVPSLKESLQLSDNAIRSRVNGLNKKLKPRVKSK